MELVFLSVFLIVLGIVCILTAIFIKKKDLTEVGPGVPTNVFEFFFQIIFMLFPSIVKRILIFLLGLGFIAGAFFLLTS
jgi:hypothetical protein